MNGQLGSMSSMNASMNTPMNNPMNAQMSSPMGQPLGQPLPPQMGMQGQMPMSLFAGKPMSASTPNLFNPQMQLGSTGMNNPKLMPRQKRGRRKKQMFPGADEDQDDISNSALGIETPSLTTIEMNESATHGESDDAGTENKPEKEKINDTENDIFMSFSDYVDW
ncbi:hypothetical protein TRFO_34053 [Tritrichomonas foetus]|uniref:Uncharacterized protein n=1 Tax=Tritrichomonas foetus TaxID=1144522 RepID=A0A1J4JK56_9EUKA|nr:hypothetical protein TRFO_34053 [Tritrichomonas foetus]|eukprot:OHS99510.1 hypothetical protein TRFO_34053 [Tritrichomonas foetus]